MCWIVSLCYLWQVRTSGGQSLHVFGDRRTGLLTPLSLVLQLGLLVVEELGCACAGVRPIDIEARR